jgi:hypothetical protein
VSPTTWTEVTTTATGWQQGTLGSGLTADDDYFIDVLFEGTALASPVPTAYTELTASAPAYTELTAPVVPWTEVSG